jgi:hypothetical protein
MGLSARFWFFEKKKIKAIPPCAAKRKVADMHRERGGAHSSLPRTVGYVSLGEERETERGNSH